jgi:hypothetical protein
MLSQRRTVGLCHGGVLWDRVFSYAGIRAVTQPSCHSIVDGYTYKSLHGRHVFDAACCRQHVTVTVLVVGSTAGCCASIEGWSWLGKEMGSMCRGYGRC